MKHFKFFCLGLVCLILTFGFSACGGGSGSGGGGGERGWAGVKGQFYKEDGSKLALQGIVVKLYEYDTDKYINQDISDANGSYAIEDKEFESNNIFDQAKKYVYITISNGNRPKGPREAFYVKGHYAVMDTIMIYR